MENTNKLVEVINQSGLDTSQADNLMKSFAGFYSQAREIVEKCKTISVTDVSQKDEMLKAKEFRGSLRDIRLDADKTRIKLKEQSLREGRAIQGVYNVLEALIKPVEDSLEKQEKFAENLEKERLEKQFEERVNKLSQYVSDVSLYSLKDMADEVFENLLAGCKLSWEKAQQEQKEAENREKQRVALEQIKQERRIEFSPYSNYIDIGDELITEMETEKYQLTLKKAKENKKVYEENQEKIRLDNIELQKKADTDRKAKEEAENKLRLEKEAQAKKEADEKAKIEAENKAKEDEEKKKLLAPDKEKLLEFATRISLVTAPAVKSKDADIILEKAMSKITEAITILQEESKKL